VNEAAIEERVAEFLDRRARQPGLDPAAFARALPAGRDEVLAAIRRALDLAATLEGAGDERPARVGDYRVLSELGRGGMGVVYEVERDGRRFALKLLPPAATLAPGAAERFRREARTLARLEHPGIVGIVEVASAAGAPFLVMEKVEGEPLARLALPLEARRAAAIVQDLARAVAAAHAAGVLHRDLKPQNVILAPGDRPVLLDFGLVAAEDESTLTRTGALLGTPRYMSPEQARGLPADERSDVFGLGLILFELVRGAPARGESTRPDLLERAARREVRVPRDGMDRRLRRVLLAALAWNPARRTRGAAELADDLERFLRGEEVRARPPGPLARGADRARRAPRSTVAALVAAVVLAIALGLTVGRSPGLSAAERAAVVAHLERALCAWLEGADGDARLELEHLLRLEPDHAAGRALEGASHDDPQAAAAAFARAAGPCAAGAVALRAHALRLAGRGDEALAALGPARAGAADSAALESERARLLDELGRAGEAARAFEAAIALAPQSAPLRGAFARSLLCAGRVEEGLAQALAAAALAAGAGRDDGLALPRLLAQAGDRAAVRAALARHLERDPADARAQFALAWELDGAHELAAARAAYERALALDPGHLRAHLNLAFLCAGAQLGSCAACARAYAAAPQTLDPERSIEALLAALELDRGRGESAAGRVVQTALDLERRAPEAAASERVGAALDDLLAAPGLAPTEHNRLAQARATLRTAGGR